MSNAAKEFIRTTLFTEMRGHRYSVPQRDIEEAVQQWLECQSLFAPLPEDATWAFEWHDADDGNICYLVVEHVKSSVLET